MRQTTKLLLKVLGIVTLVVMGVVLWRILDLGVILDPGRLEAWLLSTGPFAPGLFIVVMAATVLSPLPTFPLDVLAGSVFGPLAGTFYALTGATLGAMTSFLLARWLGRDLISRFLKGHINFCQQCSDKLLTKIVFMARLIPAVSFDMVSYGAGLTKMSWTKFGLATFIGMVPLTFLYVSFGRLLFENRTVAWIGGAIVVSLFFLLPRWIERYDLFSLRKFFVHSNSEKESSS